MGSPNTSKPIPPLIPDREVRNVDLGRQRRLRGATLLTGGQGQRPVSVGSSIVGGMGGSSGTGQS